VFGWGEDGTGKETTHAQRLPERTPVRTREVREPSLGYPTHYRKESPRQQKEGEHTFKTHRRGFNKGKKHFPDRRWTAQTHSKLKNLPGTGKGKSSKMEKKDVTQPTGDPFETTVALLRAEKEKPGQAMSKLANREPLLFSLRIKQGAVTHPWLEGRKLVVPVNTKKKTPGKQQRGPVLRG